MSKNRSTFSFFFKPKWKALPLLAILPILICIYLFGHWSLDEYFLDTDGIETKATILEKWTQSNGDVISYHIRYRFAFGNDFRSLESHRKIAIKEWNKVFTDSEILVTYLEQNPSLHRISNKSYFTSFIIVLGILALLFVILLWFIISHYRWARLRSFLNKYGERTVGKILHKSSSVIYIKNRRQIRIHYHFQDPEGQTIKKESSLLPPSILKNTDLGDEIDVLFDPNNSLKSCLADE